ncbi:MAG: asparagine synthase B [Planctomycetota bacterium]|nr:MAG: asparagine synthase B [Planctomycetota bacterium]
MCGIGGVWGGSEHAVVLNMMKQMVHRGPDAEGFYAGAYGCLGHRRLSIMDLVGGDQPIYDRGGIRAIVGNGELYNYPMLKRVLIQYREFMTHSDTESALHLYEQLGQSAAEQLDGMFALAIADHDRLYLARDPLGIKPLYYGYRGDKLVFASELKAMVGAADDVREFPPGHYYRTGEGFHRYHHFEAREPEPGSVTDHARRVRTTLEHAVSKRLMSDVPVGAFLSGGLDSSLIAAIARRHVDRLHTFSVGLEGSPDLEAARVVAAHLDTDHHEYVFTVEEVLEALPQIIYFLESFDQDLVRSAIPCYFVSRLAAEHVKVILTGEGADEIFAGYAYYAGIRDVGQLHRELLRSVTSLHNINLQRVDRLTMAHSLEGRVPFLDLKMVELAQTVPAELKLFAESDGTLTAKWILRKACEDLLPDEITWRRKEQFDEGSGTADIMPQLLARAMSEPAAVGYRTAHPEARLRSAEECTYHKILCESYDDPRPVLANVARWTDRPAA